MNIRQHIAVEKLAAGGPGSGRHPEVLRRAGFEPAGQRYGKDRYQVPGRGGHPKQGHEVVVDKSGGWVHYNSYGSHVGSGSNDSDLEQHLAKK